MLVTMFLTWLWLQILFMGLFRPNSPEAKKTRIGQQGELVAKKLIRRKLQEMGQMTFHEMAVAAMFVLSVYLWFFREPHFITGWAARITHVKVSWYSS